MLIWLRMIRFVERSNHLSNEFLEQYGLTVTQFEVLVQINAYEPITQTELAEKLTVTRGGISRMLSRLEKGNFITRKQNWKTKYISLTTEGVDKLNECYKAQVAFQSSMFDEVLSSSEKEQLNILIKKLYKHSFNKQIP